MIDYSEQLVELRQELDTLKVALQCSTDSGEKICLYARMNANLHTYLELVNASLQVALTAARPRQVM
jgi:hypothetical protein